MDRPRSASIARAALTQTALVTLLGGCSPFEIAPPDEKGKIGIVGLPAPLVTSEVNIQGNVHLVDHGLGWSADGREVIYAIQRFGEVQDEIRRINIDTREVRTISSHIALAHGLQTSPNGEYLAIVGQGLLYVGRAPGYDLIPVDAVDGCAPYVWSQDSRLIAYAIPGSRGITVRDLESADTVAHLDRPTIPLAFSPEGGELLVGESQRDTLLALRSVHLSRDSTKEWGTISVTRAWSCDWAQIVQASWDQSGIRVVHRQCDGLDCSIELFSSPPAATRSLAQSETYDRWRIAGGLPTGQNLALWLEEHIATSFWGGYAREHLYLVDLFAGQRILLANQSGDTKGGSVAFSPNDTQVAFYYNPDESWDSHQMAAPPGGVYLLRY